MDDFEYVSYEDFGRRFYEIAVTEERVGDAIAAIAGDEFEMGPMGQGPGKIAKVTAKVMENPMSGVENSIRATTIIDDWTVISSVRARSADNCHGIRGRPDSSVSVQSWPGSTTLGSADTSLPVRRANRTASSSWAYGTQVSASSGRASQYMSSTSSSGTGGRRPSRNLIIIGILARIGSGAAR